MADAGTTAATAAASGLEGVVVAETVLSEVDGERGRLILRGYEVGDLAGVVPFEEVCALLWAGRRDALPELPAQLGAARAAAFARLAALGDALAAEDGMDALRAATAHLRPTGDPVRDRVTITGALPVFAAAWWRAREGQDPLAPDPALGHAADYARMLGLPVDAARATALDAYLTTVIDHGLNASTFTARVVASTASDDVSAVVAALGALKGPLHGGAPGPVLDMLDAVGDPSRARAWLEAEVAAGRRIMGMGHRVYRVRDPRAAVLERAVETLEAGNVGGRRLALARAVEAEAQAFLAERYPNRPLKANVEFYTAVVLEAVGLDRRLFTPTFAVSRVAGWLAHTAEQRAVKRLLRPRSTYVGPRPKS